MGASDLTPRSTGLWGRNHISFVCFDCESSKETWLQGPRGLSPWIRRAPGSWARPGVWTSLFPPVFPGIDSESPYELFIARCELISMS